MALTAATATANIVDFVDEKNARGRLVGMLERSGHGCQHITKMRSFEPPGY